MNTNYTLVFRASNCFVNVYVNGKLLSSDVTKHNKIFGSSPGNRWHMVSINVTEKKCNISMELRSAYGNDKGAINNVYNVPFINSVENLLNAHHKNSKYCEKGSRKVWIWFNKILKIVDAIW